jgi:hypothetical protein
MSSGKKGRGRQKIEMKKMSNESNLQVTCSKRRSGLFKKASELCTLCGADAALVVFSPSGKVFSFGHPNLHTVIDHYLSLVPPQNNGTMQLIEAHRNANVRELNAQMTQINNIMDAEKKIGDELNHLLKETEANFWWACPVNGMNKDQLELFKKALEVLKKLLIQHATTRTLPFFVGNASFSNIYLHHQPNTQQSEMLPSHFFQNPMLQLQPHLFDGSMMPHHGFNNMV